MLSESNLIILVRFLRMAIACGNIRFSSLFVAGDVSEKRMFSQARMATKVLKTNGTRSKV